jgi:hypothetical protein
MIFAHIQTLLYSIIKNKEPLPISHSNCKVEVYNIKLSNEAHSNRITRVQSYSLVEPQSMTKGHIAIAMPRSIPPCCTVQRPEEYSGRPYGQDSKESLEVLDLRAQTAASRCHAVHLMHPAICRLQ